MTQSTILQIGTEAARRKALQGIASVYGTATQPGHPINNFLNHRSTPLPEVRSSANKVVANMPVADPMIMEVLNLQVTILYGLVEDYARVDDLQLLAKTALAWRASGRFRIGDQLVTCAQALMITGHPAEAQHLLEQVDTDSMELPNLLRYWLTYEFVLMSTGDLGNAIKVADGQFNLQIEAGDRTGLVTFIRAVVNSYLIGPEVMNETLRRRPQGMQDLLKPYVTFQIVRLLRDFDLGRPDRAGWLELKPHLDASFLTPGGHPMPLLLYIESLWRYGDKSVARDFALKVLAAPNTNLPMFQPYVQRIRERVN